MFVLANIGKLSIDKESSFYYNFSIRCKLPYRRYCRIAHVRRSFYNLYFFEVDGSCM